MDRLIASREPAQPRSGVRRLLQGLGRALGSPGCQLPDEFFKISGYERQLLSLPGLPLCPAKSSGVHVTGSVSALSE